MSKSQKRRSKRLSKKSTSSHSAEGNVPLGWMDEEFGYLPSMPDEKWIELLKDEEEDKVCFKIISQMYKVTREEQKMDYIREIVYPFTTMCCHVAWTKVLNMYFQRCDPGEKSEDITKEWKPEDEPPQPSPMDSWASWHLNIVPEPFSETGPVFVPDRKSADKLIVVKDSISTDPNKIAHKKGRLWKKLEIQESAKQVDTTSNAIVHDPNVDKQLLLQTSLESQISKKMSGHVESLTCYSDECSNLLESDIYKTLHGEANNFEDKDSLNLEKMKDFPSSVVDAHVETDKDEKSDDSYGSNGLLLRDGNIDLEDEYGYSLVNEDFSKEVDLCDTKQEIRPRKEGDKQVYLSSPIILDTSNDMKIRFEALKEQRLLFDTTRNYKI